MAGMAEKYGTAQEDNRALAESCDAMVNEWGLSLGRQSHHVPKSDGKKETFL